MPINFMGNIDCNSCDTGKPKASTVKAAFRWNARPCLLSDCRLQLLPLPQEFARLFLPQQQGFNLMWLLLYVSLKARANPTVRTFRRSRGMRGGALAAFKLRKPSPSFSVFAQGLQVECKTLLAFRRLSSDSSPAASRECRSS